MFHDAMRTGGYVLGGEASGHLIALDRATTGDGLAAGLMILGEMVRQGTSLSDLSGRYTPFPQIQAGVIVDSKPPLDSIAEIAQAISRAKSQLGRDGRVITRYSGTEPKARVMVEGRDRALVERLTREIAGAIRSAIGVEE